MNEEVTTVAADDNSLPFRYLVGGKEIDNDKLNRSQRRQFDTQRRLHVGQLKQYNERFGALRGPDGERPALVIDLAPGFSRKAKVYLEFPEALKDQVDGSDKAVKVA